MIAASWPAVNPGPLVVEIDVGEGVVVTVWPETVTVAIDGADVVEVTWAEAEGVMSAVVRTLLGNAFPVAVANRESNPDRSKGGGMSDKGVAIRNVRIQRTQVIKDKPKSEDIDVLVCCWELWRLRPLHRDTSS